MIDRERTGVAALLRRAPAAIGMVGAAEQLPLRTGSLDAVVIGQGFHQLAPGLAIPEIARVLAPNGRLIVSYTVRDDTVPWVRRLVARLREEEPDALPGDYGSDSIGALDSHAGFPARDERSFRLWSPVNRETLVAMVAATSVARELSAEERERLLADVADIYAAAARPPEPLLLPYRVRCWRATVDHRTIEMPDASDDGFQIFLT